MQIRPEPRSDHRFLCRRRRPVELLLNYLGPSLAIYGSEEGFDLHFFSDLVIGVVVQIHINFCKSGRLSFHEQMGSVLGRVVVEIGEHFTSATDQSALELILTITRILILIQSSILLAL